MNRQECMKLIEGYGVRASEFAWEDKACYASWLYQTYSYVCHSTRLIALAASRFYINQESLHSRFIKHIGEEHFHERLALKDMREAGADPDEYPELSITKGFYQSQYYQIERVNPACMIGYILALEGIAVTAGKGVLERVTDQFGKAATSFLRVHSEEDIEHIEQAFVQYESLPSDIRPLVFENMRQSGELYCKILDGIEEIYLDRAVKKSA